MRKVINLVLALGILSPSIAPACSKVDKVLEEEIAREYNTFREYTVEGLKHKPCLAVQFVYDLQEKLHKNRDEYNAKKLSQKLIAIISEGAGVGGIDINRQATEIERKILMGALYEAIENKNILPTFSSSNSSPLSSLLHQHYQVVFSIYQAKQSQTFTLKSTNFLNDPDSYAVFIKNLNKYLEIEESKNNFTNLNDEKDKKEKTEVIKPNLSKSYSSNSDSFKMPPHEKDRNLPLDYVNSEKWEELYKETNFVHLMNVLKTYVKEEHLHRISSLKILFGFTISCPSQILDEKGKQNFRNGVKRIKLLIEICQRLTLVKKLPENLDALIHECNKNWKKYDNLKDRLYILSNDYNRCYFEDWFRKLALEHFKLPKEYFEQIMCNPSFKRFEDKVFSVVQDDSYTQEVMQAAYTYLDFTQMFDFCHFSKLELVNAIREFYADITKSFSPKLRQRLLLNLKEFVSKLKDEILFSNNQLNSKEVEITFSNQLQKIIDEKNNLKNFEYLLEKEEASLEMTELMRNLMQNTSLRWSVGLYEYQDNLINSISVFNGDKILNVLQIVIENSQLKEWLRSQKSVLDNFKLNLLFEMLNFKDTNYSPRVDFNNYFVNKLNERTTHYNGFIKQTLKPYLEQQLLRDLDYFDYILGFYKIEKSIKVNYSNANVKKAFRDVCLYIHPDKNTSLEATEIFKSISSILERIENFNNIYRIAAY